MPTIKEMLFALTCLSFSIVIGGAVYEHIASVPRWSAAPPVSLSMFQGKYGLNPAPFWMSIHPTTLLLFLATLVACWKTGSRIHIILPLCIYVGVLTITAIYFVPELMSITQTPISDTVDSTLTARAQTWETLSLIRLGVLILIALYLFLGLGKVGQPVKIKDDQAFSRPSVSHTV
jgi:hypothetical protein